MDVWGPQKRNIYQSVDDSEVEEVTAALMRNGSLKYTSGIRRSSVHVVRPFIRSKLSYIHLTRSELAIV